MAKRNLIITESQLYTLYQHLQEDKKIMRGEFNNDVVSFLDDIIKDPIHCDISDKLKNAGVTKGQLIRKMMDNGMISKDENFIEVEEGKKISENKYSQHKIKYTVHNRNFDKNMDDLYDSLIKECDCGGCMGGGALGGSNVMVGSSDESGGITYPMGGKSKVMRRGGYNSQKKTGDVTKQKTNTVDMSDALSRDTKHGIAMNRQK